jgi:transcriptional regulator with XRE-family HTH domain
MHPALEHRPSVSSRKPSPQHFPNVSRALREIRQAHGLTQEDMAPILGLSFAGYRPYERAERDLTQSQIEAIATHLGVPVWEITRRLWPDDRQLVETRFFARLGRDPAADRGAPGRAPRAGTARLPAEPGDRPGRQSDRAPQLVRTDRVRETYGPHTVYRT